MPNSSAKQGSKLHTSVVVATIVSSNHEGFTWEVQDGPHKGGRFLQRRAPDPGAVNRAVMSAIGKKKEDIYDQADFFGTPCLIECNAAGEVTSVTKAPTVSKLITRAAFQGDRPGD